MSETTEERSLADTVEAASVDATVPTTPADFDMDAWLSGVRPTRRSIKLYPQAHLIARLDEIADQIDRTPADEPVDDLIDEFEQVKAQFEDGTWFTVQKMSSEAVEKLWEDTRKRLGLPKRAKDAEETESQVLLHQVATQIVSPTVTAEQLERLEQTNQGEFNKLMNLVMVVNNKLAESSGVLTRDFSRRRSAPEPG